MKKLNLNRRHTFRGFTLIELVVVIGMISVAARPILGLFIESAKSIESNYDIQTATQLVQECAEHMLAEKRTRVVAYASLSTDCTALTYPFNGFPAPTVTITDPYDVTGVAGCPATASCKLVQIDAI